MTGIVILMGLRGSGKSTVGKALAKRLDTAFIDLDDRTAALLDSPDCATAINARGWQPFREAESAALKQALTEHPAVLALGGGTPTHAASERLLITNTTGTENTITVYLHTTPETTAQRVEAQGRDTRPALTEGTALDEANKVYNDRDPLYRRLATHVIETDGTAPDDIAASIEDWIKRRPA